MYGFIYLTLLFLFIAFNFHSAIKVGNQDRDNYIVNPVKTQSGFVRKFLDFSEKALNIRIGILTTC